MKKIIKKNNSGFTLIEMLVVTTVIALLSAGVIVYGGNSRTSIVLFQEQYRIVNELNQAKALTLQFFNRDVFSSSGDCGYGVHFDFTNKEIFIYKNKKSNPTESCSDIGHNFRYNPGDEIKSGTKFILDPTINVTSDGFVDAVFIAPNAQLFIIDANGSVIPNPPLGAGYYKISLTAPNVGRVTEIKLNTYGQISAF